MKNPAGQRIEFDQLFNQQRVQLRRVVVGMGLSVVDGEDILQDVCVKALEKPIDCNEPDDVAQWLIRVTVNRCLLELRRRNLYRRKVKEILRQWLERRKAVLGPEKDAIVSEEQEIIRQALKELDVMYRAPLVLKYFCQFNSSEIAKILQLKPGTIRKRQNKARIILAEKLLRKGIKS